jgi:hypothetical protein
MSHFAQVKNARVQQVIVAEQEFIDQLPDAADWRQTSYRTRGNQHPEGRALRGNYAGAGDIYDALHDVFYGPRPYPSWQLNTTTWSWESPVPYPMDDTSYTWDETTQTWLASGQ